MKVLIVDNDLPSIISLKQLIQEIEPQAEAVAELSTVKESIKWLSQNPHPDLFFMEIQLSDGLSFEIYQSAEINSPVIFTTTHNEYMLRAFKVNSIDYLMKPVVIEELRFALHKFRVYQKNNSYEMLEERMHSLFGTLVDHKHQYKTRFLVKFGDRLEPIPVHDIAYFHSEEKHDYLITNDGHRFIIDQSLNELEPQLDPSFFFRLNRQYISSVQSITRIFNHLNGKLKIQLKGNGHGEIFVPRERAGEFKRWLDS